MGVGVFYPLLSQSHHDNRDRQAEGRRHVGKNSAGMARICETEKQELVESKNLLNIGVKADEVRRRLHGARTTFVRVFEIHLEAPVGTLPPRTSAGEFRINGSPKSLQAAVEAVRCARLLAGNVPLSGFSLGELSHLEG